MHIISVKKQSLALTYMFDWLHPRTATGTQLELPPNMQICISSSHNLMFMRK